MLRSRGHPSQGAISQCDGSFAWRVWAPLSNAVNLVLHDTAGIRAIAMAPEGRGYFAHCVPSVAEGLRYTYCLANGHQYPDPASRWQPDGVHQPSAVFLPALYRWSDAQWRGIPRKNLVIYELHIGAFTPEGTFDAAIGRLPELSALGVTAVEIMPVAQFPGERGWGYDGVYLNAVQNSYGGPHALQRFVDAAHGNCLAVILDVVYNHFGPEGNYTGAFGPYLTDRYRTPWGPAMNYDGPGSDAVRQFVIDNACAWVRDFHVDGLRLDAVQSIYDGSPRHIVADIAAAVRKEAARQQRMVHVIGESDQNDVRLLHPQCRNGFGLDAVWSDDFHHAVHALLTGERDRYYVDYGTPRHVVKACNKVFVYDGCYSQYLGRRRGSRVGDIDRTRFIACLQNHDQVGNRAGGERMDALVPWNAHRMACGLLLLAPFVPLLFMGEEYGESRAFPFFCSFGDSAIVDGVRRGRHEELAAATRAATVEMVDPQSPATFIASKLAWAWPEGSNSAGIRALYQDLLGIRRRWPARRGQQQCARLLRSAVADDPDRPGVLLLRRGGAAGVLAVANLAGTARSAPKLSLDHSELLLSTEDARYGGSREPDRSCDALLPYEMLLFRRRGGQP